MAAAAAAWEQASTAVLAVVKRSEPSMLGCRRRWAAGIVVSTAWDACGENTFAGERRDLVE